MGRDRLALCGRDDAAEMSSWYIFNAIGLYPYSPADPEYIATVPLFDRATLRLNDHSTFTIARPDSGTRITDISYSGDTITGYFIPHNDLLSGGILTIHTQ